MRAGCVGHEFFAPINGEALRFGMYCKDGVPFALFARDNGDKPKPDARIAQQLAVLNVLIAEGLPWAAVCTQHQGDVGAVIEAAEARRLEIYGAREDAA